MEHHDDISGEQTDSGISSTFTNDIEQIFAETVNNVNMHCILKKFHKTLIRLFSFLLVTISIVHQQVDTT